MRFNLKFTLSQKVPFQPNLFSFWWVRNYSLIMSESLLTNFYSLSLLLILSLLWWSGSCSFIYKTFSFPKSSFAFLPLSLSRHHLMLLLSLCSHWLHLSLWKCFLSLSLSFSFSDIHALSHTLSSPSRSRSFILVHTHFSLTQSISFSLSQCLHYLLSLHLTYTHFLSLASFSHSNRCLPSIAISSTEKFFQTVDPPKMIRSWQKKLISIAALTFRVGLMSLFKPVLIYFHEKYITKIKIQNYLLD